MGFTGLLQGFLPLPQCVASTVPCGQHCIPWLLFAGPERDGVCGPWDVGTTFSLRAQKQPPPARSSSLCPSPASATQLRLTHRFHQAAGTAMELPPLSPNLAGHCERDRPGLPDGAAAARSAGARLPSPGAAVDGWEAAVELLAGLGALQPQGGDGLWGPAMAAWCRGGCGAGPGRGGRGMASLQERA